MNLSRTTSQKKERATKNLVPRAAIKVIPTRNLISKGRKGKGNKRCRLKAQEGEYNTEEEVVSEHPSEPPELIDDNHDTTPPLDEQEVST